MATVQDHSHVATEIDEQFDIGFAHRCSGDYAQARVAFENVLREEPKHLKARWQIALIEGFEGDFDSSVAHLRDLAKEAPEELDLRFDFAMTAMMIGEFDEACNEFRAIVAIDPEHKAKDQLIYC